MAGIYIPGMEMPRKGQMLVIFPDGASYVCFNGMRERMAQTTAVPVPDHGRLIDAKWVRDAIIPKWVENADDSFMYKRGMEDAYEVVRNAPTIIPADKEGEE